MHKRVEGFWSLADGTSAFTATEAHGGRETTLSIDVAPGCGGGGAPVPLQYMLGGSAPATRPRS